MEYIIYPIVCGVAFRLRGDAILDAVTHLGTTGGRLLWALTLTACIVYQTQDWWTLLCLPVAFLCMIPGWRESIDLGRHVSTWRQDAINLGKMGVIRVSGPALALLLVGYLSVAPMLVAGLFIVPLYELGWRLPTISERFHLRQGPEIGELLFGAAVGLSVAFI